MSFEPLKGVRVLDLTSVVVGPVCTWRLGQYGAEIIKVENPEGDLMRGLGGQSPTGQHSGTYLHLNRGKRNICLDLKKPGASDVMQRLIASADVIVANMRPQALERLGLDANSIRSQHPEKIYCLITGYGTDPYLEKLCIQPSQPVIFLNHHCVPGGLRDRGGCHPVCDGGTQNFRQRLQHRGAHVRDHGRLRYAGTPGPAQL